MAKFNKETLVAIFSQAQDLNFKGKRLASKKMEVAETITENLGLDSADSVFKFLSGETYRDFWEEKEAEKRKAKPARFSSKLAADTMQGTNALKLEQMEALQGSRFIITAAQNNTKPSEVFEQLQFLSNEIDAQLVVLPYYYNKNAFSPAAENDREHFDPSLRDYLVKQDTWIGEMMDVRLCPSANVLPTAKLPVNAAAQLNAGELATIVPSSKQQLKTLPRLNNAPIKEAWTTGTCTQYNYIECRAGAEAETEHVFGGLLVEIDQDGSINITNIRQSDDGSLALQLEDRAFGINCALEDPCLILGDLHCEMQDPIAYAKTLQQIDMIKPKMIAVHDVLHFETRSHHNRHSGKHLYKMYHKGQTVINDLRRVIEQLNELADKTEELYIVESNHNSALDNWLDDSSYNPKQDPENAKLYYLLNWAVCNSIDEGEDRTALEVALLDIVKETGLTELRENIRFGYMDQPEIWYGWDVSQHGHKGQNGAAGNPNQINKWRLNLITGHTHSPSIVGNVFTVGVLAKLNQGYNRGGASSWNQANAIIHSNGSVQMMRVNNLSK